MAMFSWRNVRSVESEIFLTCYKVQIIVFNTHVHTHTYQHNREFLREHAVETVGLKRTGNRCLGGGSRGNCRYLNHCVQAIAIWLTYRGKLRDTVLDWKDCLPKEDLEKAEHYSRFNQ